MTYYSVETYQWNEKPFLTHIGKVYLESIH